METEFIENSVRKRLILAGITELEERGVKDFSLRRVAMRAQVSCAAPYRHFKSKEELIEKIIEYIGGKRELFCKEIIKMFDKDKKRLIIELSLANLRFWLANPNFRSVLLLGEGGGLSEIDTALSFAISDYCKEREITDTESYLYLARALTYGTVVIIGEGSSDTFEQTVARMKHWLEQIFK